MNTVHSVALCGLLALTACAPAPTTSQANLQSTEVAAGAVITRVFEAFNRCQIGALVSQYSAREVVFFTSGTPEPIRSRADLGKYFSYLDEVPCASPESTKHTQVTPSVRPMAPGVAVVHVNTVVAVRDEGKDLRIPFRFTFVVKDEGDGWFVVSQDAQRIPSAQPQQ